MADKPCLWTPDTLHQHFTAVLEERQRAQDAALKAMEYRLAGMNEFRATVEDVIKNTPTRAETSAHRREFISFLFAAIGATLAGVTLIVSIMK